MCDIHSQGHKLNKQNSQHNQVPISFSISSKCSKHEEDLSGFCKTCFSLTCPSCINSNQSHPYPEHQTFYFTGSNLEEEKNQVYLSNLEEEKNQADFLIQKSQIFVQQINDSLQDIKKMISDSQQRALDLIASSTEYFFKIFEKIIPEIKQSLFQKFQRNEQILLHQKNRAESQIILVEKFINKIQQSFQEKESEISHYQQNSSLQSHFGSFKNIPCTLR